MSELRDLAAALRSFDKRICSIEECLLVVVRNSEQESDWRHLQKNIAQSHELKGKEQERSLKQVEEFQSALWSYLGKLDERLENLSIDRHDDMRALSERVRALEPEDEVTKA